MLKYGVLIFAILMNIVSLFVINDVNDWKFHLSIIWIALLSVLCFLNVYIDRSGKNG